MAITKDKKVKIVDKLKKALADSNSVVFVNFQGLSVPQATELRETLREQSVGYTVAKKSLIKLALNDAKFSGQMPELPGEIALAYGTDLVAPAKGIHEFGKKAEQLSIVGGVFEGEYMDKVAMTSIAEIPPREVLYGQFVNMINYPIQGLVIALNSIADKKE